MTRRTSYDAIIVGARCAGAATAMLLARRGLRVLAIDRQRYGSDSRSTHALMRGGVLQLQRWGLLGALAAAGTPAVRHVTFHYGDEAMGVPIQARDGVDALYAPRRTLLDALLVDAARDAGAEIHHRAELRGLLRSEAGRVIGAVIEDAEGTRRLDAAIVIGADGVASSVARRVGAEPFRRGDHKSSVIYGYFPGLRVDGYHWHYLPGVSVGVIPTNDGNTCVFVAVPPRRLGEELGAGPDRAFHHLLREAAPELARLLERVGSAAPVRVFGGVAGHLRPAWGPGWALVGDAGYFKDPITAHGITDALRDAELLARAVAAGGNRALAHYQAQRDALSLPLFEVSDEIASFAWDLERVKECHRQLSRAMALEARALVALHEPSPAGHGVPVGGRARDGAPGLSGTSQLVGHCR
jgi:2-polyprenyl-6-methoxyphenol hydroxylase-like FAD-dependent oxidoreductase